MNPRGKDLSLSISVIIEKTRKFKNTVGSPKDYHPPKLDYYTPIKYQGGGSFAHVWLARENSTGKLVVVKYMPDLKNLIHHANKEVEILKYLTEKECPYVASCKKSWYDEFTDSFYIIMEFINGVELYDILDHVWRLNDPFSEQDLCIITRELLQGLYFLHSHRIAHMDIKIENVIITPKRIVYVDFGLSRFIDRGNEGLMYLRNSAPERRLPSFGNKPEDFLRNDMWCLGITIMELASSDLVVNKRNINIHNILGNRCDRYPILVPLISRMLEIDVNKRVTVENAWDEINKIFVEKEW